MKKIAILSLALLSFSATAATVKITSFLYVNDAGRMAEICGVVEEMVAAPTFVKIKVDPGSNRPGSYSAIAGDDGKFCLAVVTYRGTAEASLYGETKVVKVAAR